MFVLVLAGVAALTATGWLVTRQRYVDDEVPGWSSNRLRDDVPEVAGTEPPARASVGPGLDRPRPV
jgi:CP family cyanate transporter-like MFS transporter